jgi:transposase InsO family protein
MSVRLAIIEADPASMNVTRFCADHGVSTWLFYDLRRRYALEGPAALELKSRAPLRPGNRVSAEVEDRIVRARKELTDDGFDAGPASIKDLLGDAVPSEATIWRVLRRRGLVVPEPAKAPKWTGRRFEAERANECWQIDATHWPLDDDSEVEIINVIDDRSRLCVASHAVAVCTTANSFDAITQAASRFGWPERVLSDNGSAFRGNTNKQTIGGLAAALHELGIATSRSRPFHPQTCGKVERFHQTLKRWLDARDHPATLAELQALLDCFVEHYNTRRRHRSIGRRTPLEVWSTTPRSGPAAHPINAATVVFRSTAHQGNVRAGRRWIIAIGNQHDGRVATVVLTGHNCHVFIDGRFVRRLTINPDRGYQPLYDRPGRPDPTHLL